MQTQNIKENLRLLLHPKASNKGGYTFIELIIVATVVGILAVSVFSSFTGTRETVVYQAQLTAIQNIIDDVRDMAFSAKESSEYVVRLGVNTNAGQKQNVVAYKNVDRDLYSFSEAGGDILVKSLDLAPSTVPGSEGFLSLGILKILNLNNASSATNWQIAPSKNVAIVFVNQTKTCEINLVSPNGTLASAVNPLMFQMPLINTSSTGKTYLYFHKESCIPEVLYNDFTL